MVNSCAAYDCTNRVKGDGMKFHRFPLKNKELCAKWIAAMKRDKFIQTKNSYYCGCHFITSDSMDEVPQLDMGDNPLFMMPPMNSENKENILGYIGGGYIVKKLQKIIDCNVCNNAMLSSNKYYFNLPLVTQKERGGLVYPSTDIVKILSIAKRVFKSFVIGADNRNPGISSSKHLRLKQAVIKEFLNMRLFRYGQEYSKCVLMKNCIGKRQQLNKFVLFKGL